MKNTQKNNNTNELNETNLNTALENSNNIDNTNQVDNEVWGEKCEVWYLEDSPKKLLLKLTSHLTHLTSINLEF